MKIWKLVAGILSIVFFLIVVLQSCAAGMVDALEDSGGTSGSAGILVAFFMLAGGVVSIVTRNSKGKGGNIALIILFGLAALIGLTMHGVYSDLIIWGAWCVINAVLALVAIITGKEKAP